MKNLCCADILEAAAVRGHKQVATLSTATWRVQGVLPGEGRVFNRSSVTALQQHFHFSLSSPSSSALISCMRNDFRGIRFLHPQSHRALCRGIGEVDAAEGRGRQRQQACGVAVKFVRSCLAPMRGLVSPRASLADPAAFFNSPEEKLSLPALHLGACVHRRPVRDSTALDAVWCLRMRGNPRQPPLPEKHTSGLRRSETSQVAFAVLTLTSF